MKRTVLAVLAGSTIALVGAGTLGVTTASAAPATAGTADIRAAHLAPDIAGVDVYLSGFRGGATKVWSSDLKYGGVTGYTSITAGLYVVALRPHGQPATSAPLLSWDLNAQAGHAYTAAAVGDGSAHKGTVLTDDLQTPKPGTGRVRLIQAASAAPEATVKATDGPVVAQNAAFATSTGYAEVPAGTWPLIATSVQDSAVSTTGSVSVASASVTSIVLLDKPGGGIELHTILDAAGAAKMPKGAVPAGGGGTASVIVDRGSALGLWSWGALGVVGVLGLGAWLRRRVRATSST